MIFKDEIVDLETPTGQMRTYLYRPMAAGKYPAVMFFSEIFQQTDPIRRAASMLAGHGFVVLVPEIFHELNPIGTVLSYDEAGKDKGNQDKLTKTVECYDADTRALITFLSKAPYCTGKIGAMGICIGGHLAFRAAFHDEVLATICLYATDIHSHTLPVKDNNDDSLKRCEDIKGEIQMIWGKQDPHIPTEGRRLIYQTMSEAGVNFTWHEFNAQHAFIRDEGQRYDPELTLTCFRLAFDLFNRKLNEGDINDDEGPCEIDTDC